MLVMNKYQHFLHTARSNPNVTVLLANYEYLEGSVCRLVGIWPPTFKPLIYQLMAPGEVQQWLALETSTPRLESL